MKKCYLLWVSLFFIGCNNPTLLMSPVCPEDRWDIPNEYEGEYSFQFLDQSKVHGRAWVPDRMVVSIRRDSQGVMSIFANDVKRAGVSFELSPSFHGNFCEIGGSLYLQERSLEGGGYLVNKIHLGHGHVEIAALTFSPESLKDAEVPFFFKPSLDAEELQKDEDPFSSIHRSPFVELIVDNRHIDPEALLAVGTPLSMVYAIDKISDETVLKTANLKKIY